MQLDVLRVRLADEYGLNVDWEMPAVQLARWFTAKDRKIHEQFVSAHRSAIAEDLDGDHVFLARNAFDLDYTGKLNPGLAFTDIKDIHSRPATPE